LGLELYQPTERSWREYAGEGGLRSVLDPRDRDGRKNRYIDALHKRAIETAGLPIDGGVVLDYGCGNGRIARFLRGRCSLVVGVDITHDMLVAAASSRSTNDLYLRNDPIALPFPEGAFDLIVSTYVLQYFAHEPPVFAAVAAELRRVIKPDGTLLIIEQVSRSGRGSGSVGRGCRVRDYVDPIEAAGFEQRRGFVVRPGQPSWVARRTLLRYDVPDFLHRAIVSGLLRSNQRIQESSLSADSYADYLLCFGSA
jgi:SAM-dependent methyltransferase